MHPIWCFAIFPSSFSPTASNLLPVVIRTHWCPWETEEYMDGAITVTVRQRIRRLFTPGSLLRSTGGSVYGRYDDLISSFLYWSLTAAALNLCIKVCWGSQKAGSWWWAFCCFNWCSYPERTVRVQARRKREPIELLYDCRCCISNRCWFVSAPVWKIQVELDSITFLSTIIFFCRARNCVNDKIFSFANLFHFTPRIQ